MLAFFFGERLAFFALVFFLVAISVAPRTTSTACGQKSGNSLGCSGSGQSARNATSVYRSKRNFNPCLTLEQELQKRVNTSLAIQAAIDHRVAGLEPLAKRLGVEPAREYDCRSIRLHALRRSQTEFSAIDSQIEDSHRWPCKFRGSFPLWNPQPL